ncbi:MAG: GIN domain-containing protein [Muribaculaceae bacterium]
MKKILVIMAVAMAAMGCVTAQNTVETQRFAFNKGDFGKLRVNDNVNVEYVASADSAGYIVFECDPRAASDMLFTLDKETLKIETADEDALRFRLPTIRVYSRFLSSVENSGDSTVYINSPAPGAEISLRVVGNGSIVAKGLHAGTVNAKIDTGNGSIVLGGEASVEKLRNVGAGTIQAGGLKAQSAQIIIGGTGSVDCWVTDDLSVKGLGSGKIYLKGDPKIKNRTLGSIKVVKMDQPE